MLAAVRTAAVLGIDAYDVTVEVDVAQGMPNWFLVGLPSSAVKESRERVGAALVNSGLAIPARRITINLSPADVRKDGTAFDLPIALGLLVAVGRLPAECLRKVVAVGELGLDGSVRPVRGVLSVARRVAAIAPDERPTLLLPPANVGEAALVPDVPLCAPATLGELLEWLDDSGGALPAPPKRPSRVVEACTADFAEVVGQATAKRALEIAAAGGHACLLVGPPGAGKTMLARRLPGILPKLLPDEALEATAIHSVAGLLRDVPFLAERPFRAPHHSISVAGLVGGGGVPRPGEVSLAHHGVLFLDELLEFPRAVLEAMRQPMEDGRVAIARATTAVSFPARFALVAAMNPCPCGNAGEPTRVCVCGAAEIQKYRARLSGPLADRIDMHVTVGAVPVEQLRGGEGAESSPAIRARVEAARLRQGARYAAHSEWRCNAQVPGQWLTRHGALTSDARKFLADAARKIALSARGYHRVIRVARTIADLAGDDRVGRDHVAEALRYRGASPEHLAASPQLRSG